MTTIVGVGLVGPSDLVETPLDEMIFDATAAALTDAGEKRDEVDLVCAAASDVYDGRGISTMTLTESLGSMGKWEHRVCNDSLVALDLAAAHIEAGLARGATVGAWNKGSDIVDPSSIAATNIEPLQRGLGVPAFAFDAMARQVGVASSALRAEPRRDVAIVLILSGGDSVPGTRLVAHRRRTTNYLHQVVSHEDRLKELVREVCEAAGIAESELSSIKVTGSLCGDAPEWTGVEPVAESREVGYAAGLLGIASVLRAGAGKFAVCSSSSIGEQEMAVTIVENSE